MPYVSVVSLWEIAMKVAQGGLRFDVPLEEVIEREFSANGYVRLEIEDRHLSELLRLPHPSLSHGDPFARLLAAQARAPKGWNSSAQTRSSTLTAFGAYGRPLRYPKQERHIDVAGKTS